MSRARLMQMLDTEFEFDRVVNRLANVRSRNTTFFAYAATITARSFRQQNECHGWVGMRLQLHPGPAPGVKGIACPCSTTKFPGRTQCQARTDTAGFNLRSA